MSSKNFKLTSTFFDMSKEKEKLYFPTEKITKKSKLYGLGMHDIPAEMEKVIIAMEIPPELIEVIREFGGKTGIHWIYIQKIGMNLKPGSTGDRPLIKRFYEQSIAQNNTSGGTALLHLEAFSSKKEMVKRENELKDEFFKSASPYAFRTELFPITKDTPELLKFVLDINFGRIKRFIDNRKTK